MEQKTYAIKLPLSSCTEELVELQENLKKYSGRTIIENSTPPRHNKLVNLHVGAVNSFRIGFNPLCINFNSERETYITEQSKEITVTLEENRITCKTGPATYVYDFLEG